MQGPHPEMAKESEPTELLQLAQKRFMQWHQERETERAEKARAIQAGNQSSLGRAARRLELWKERLAEDTRQRCRIYRDVALERNCQAMLSESELDELKGQIMTGLHFARLALKQCNANLFFATGDVSPGAENAAQDRVDLELQVRIRSVANAELDVLRSEGAVWRKTGLPPGIGNPEFAKDRLLDGKTEVDLKTAAEYLGKSLSHVRKLAQQGTLTVTKSTRPKMVTAQSARRYLRPGK